MLQLRRATPSDYEYTKHVQHTAYKDMVLRQFGAWEEPVQTGFFDRSWNASPYDIILWDGEPCGYCNIHEHAHVFQLVEFAVEVSKQGRGIGSALLARFKQMARDKGKCAQLNVMKTNTRAKALYERMGFSVYGETPVHFQMRASDSPPK